MYLSIHCHHQNDICIKVGSDESHFNVSFIVRDKVTRQCPQTTNFLKRKESRSGIEQRSCLHTHTHTRTHARTHTRTHARTHARTHVHAYIPA